MNLFPRLISIILIFSFFSAFSQERGDFRIMFYNVENLFDIVDDPETIDEEFLPDGERFWNYKRFQEKLNNLSKVIIAAGGWDAPGLIGLCEIENRFVVEQLLEQTPLQKYNYGIIHKESPDERGIDVSLIYSKGKFQPLSFKYFPVKNEKGELLTTREILYVKGIACQADTIHLFLNHWPSRYGGYLETVNLRFFAAKTLRSAIDSISLQNTDSKIIVMGDFNDQPTDESISDVLEARSYHEKSKEEDLINLSSEWVEKKYGTIKYQAQWLIYDQVIVSRNLIESTSGIYCLKNGAEIFYRNFLVEPDETYGGEKPFRSYSGFHYQGGFSDHLPVYLDLFLRRQ